MVVESYGVEDACLDQLAGSGLEGQQGWHLREHRMYEQCALHPCSGFEQKNEKSLVVVSLRQGRPRLEMGGDHLDCPFVSQ